MIRRHIGIFLFLVFFILLAEGKDMILQGEEKQTAGIRESILAGQWYPGDRDTLSRMINTFLENAQGKSINGDIIAGIVPHAGYVYSGQIAACAYSQFKGKGFKRVIIIGPSHRVGFNGISVNLQSGYKTPLGIAPVDRAYGQRLIQSGKLIGFIPNAHESEHSIEIQVPFLQTVLKDFSIVPVVMGDTDERLIDDLAGAILSLRGDNEKTLILASTDLSHFHRYNEARQLDKEFIRHIEQFDPKGLSGALASGSCEACGRAPVITTMLAAKELNADRSEILCYANSGDVTGDKNRVVGYVSALFVRGN